MRGQGRPKRQGSRPAKAAAKSRQPGARAPRKRAAPARDERATRLAEALEQQTATGEILRLISSSPANVQPIFDAIVDRATRLCKAEFSAVARFDEGLLHLVTISNMVPAEREAYHSLFPRPPHRGFVMGRAVLEGRPVHVEDVLADPDYDPHTLQVLQRAASYRTYLGIPILRQGVPIGVIGCGRRRVKAFSEREIALVQIFADQAAIAIENARLLNELQARNHDLGEALEREEATADVLGIVSRSPADVQPVFDAIARSAARLCEGDRADLFRFDGTLIHHVTMLEWTSEATEEFLRIYPRPADRQSIPGWAILDRAVLHFPDAERDPRLSAAMLHRLRLLGIRALVVMPMLRDGEPVGAIGVTRREPRPFSEAQIALLRTFADQAVIALENARRLQELRARNTELGEALGHQTAMAEILRVISSSPTDIQPVFDTIARSAKQLCDAQFCFVFRFDGALLHFVAQHGLSPEAHEAVRRAWPRAPGPGTAGGRSILSRGVAHIPDVHEDPGYVLGGVAEAATYRSTVAVPLLRDGIPVGTINVSRSQAGPFTDRQIDLLQTFAAQAVIAVENVRLFTEVQARNRALTEALEQQTATAEILRVISSSPTDLRPVMAAVAENAARLCEADDAQIFRVDGDRLRWVGGHGSIASVDEFPLGRGSPSGRAVVDQQAIHVADLGAEADTEFPDTRSIQRQLGLRTVLAAPMLREGMPIGAIAIRRLEVRPFSNRQIDLLRTFADQAVIAVENVRLFTEVQARNRDLTRTLDQQTATSEILRVISSSPTDIEPVFRAIVTSGRRLSEAQQCTLVGFDGEMVSLLATDNYSAEGEEELRHVFPYRAHRGGTAGRTVLDRQVVHIPDVMDDPEYSFKAFAKTAEYRAHLGIPMFRGVEVIGVLIAARAAPGPFPPDQIELLKTFADQAVIAIENVRLFKELQARNQDLTVALEQQTATSEVLKVISRSAFDLQPVLESVIESATRLCGATRGHIFRFDGEILRFAAAYGAWPEFLAHLERNPVRPGPGSVAGRAAAERRLIHVHDVLAEEGYEYRELIKQQEYRTALAVPMLRDDTLLGVIVILKSRVAPFTDNQIELVTTFADQAVIAVENARLFKELETRNRDLTETLEQQMATGEILRVISSSPTDAQPVFETIAESAKRLCEAEFCQVFRLEDGRLHFVAYHGLPPQGVEAARRAFPSAVDRGSVAGRAVLSAAVVHIADVHDDPEYTLSAVARAINFRGIVGVPMMREGVPIGAITVARSAPGYFPPRQVDLLRTFADQAVIAIENVRLFKELEVRNRDLTETLEQQTATSEILRVISSSPTDVQPVFDAIVESAVRLCEAFAGGLLRFDGELLHPGTVKGPGRERILQAWTGFFPYRPGPEVAIGQAVIERRVIHIEDVLALPANPLREATQRAGGYRAFLAVPMLRENTVVGIIACWRAEARAFSDRQISLMQTLADQAVIAIENVRLFQELEARTRDLTRSVGELQALGEVSQAVSSTLDLETVLNSIVEHAVQLSSTDGGLIYEYDEARQAFVIRGSYRLDEDLGDVIRQAPIRLGEGVAGRAAASREPVQVPDILDEAAYDVLRIRAVFATRGFRSLLGVPLLFEQRVIGVLTVWRREAGGFAPDAVRLLQTLAAQSVVAINNARLFRETRRQKQYADALVETSPVAIVTMDLEGNVVGWNPGAERLFGYPQAEALGRRMEDLVATPEVRDDVRANIRQTLGGEWIRTIARRARKDGTLVDVEISSMPVVVEGARVGMIGIYHDITELLRARREAEAANEAKSAFLATMSHEIRTPMNAVIGMSGLLLNTPLSDEQREYAEIVRQSGDALLTVINDILDFSKIEAGKLELESQPFDVRDCVESALDLVATRAAEKGLDLAYLIGDGTPAGITGDVTRLRQILLNLLSNAVKFTETGEVVLSVSARRLEGMAALHELTFAVRDTGIGIAPDRLDRLFQSFSQVDASTTRRYGGTGLGLAISQRLTELMGGRISVASEVGQGSEFRFTIRAPAAEVPVTARRDLSGVQPSLRGKSVLVVDDNATNRRILTAHLDAWGMRARATGSPLEALEWVRADVPFDIGILDMHMPEMDGVTLARAVRERTSADELPLVLFTSLGRREARAESEGFAAYLHKPIKPSQLFDALVSVLAEQPVHVRERGVARRELDPDMARRHPLRILLAEDNVVNQKVALRLLGQMGYRADVAANGLEAIEAVERQTYDVVLMDVQMPELDGLEASREINRRWPGGRRPRLVAMTANAMQDDRDLCVAAGMDDYVAKPVRIEELVAALERCRPRPDADVRSRPAGAPPVPPAESAEGSGLAVPPGAPVLDQKVLERLAATMGSSFVEELIDTFREDARELIVTLRRALGETDRDAFRRAAHSLKSTSESLGAVTLASLARELEALGRTGNLAGGADRLEELADQYELVARAIGKLGHDRPA